MKNKLIQFELHPELAAPPASDVGRGGVSKPSKRSSQMTVKELFKMLDERGIEYEVLGPSDVYLTLLSAGTDETRYKTRYTHVVVTEEAETCYYMICGTAEDFTFEPDYNDDDEVVEFPL